MEKKSIFHALSLALILALVMIPGASAASLHSASITSGVPVGSRFPLSPVSNTPGHTSEQFPALAFNSGFMQTYLVAWTQPSGDGNQSVYTRFINSDGSLNGIPFPVTDMPPTSIASNPDVAYDSNLDRYLIVYERGIGIYGQILTNAGADVGSEITIANGTPGTDDFNTPAVAYSPTSSKYLITWQHQQNTKLGIEARILSGDGSTLGSVWGLTGLIEEDPANPDVAYTFPLDSFLVVWQKTYTGESDHDIYAQRIQMGATPGPVGGVFSIFFSINDEVNPSIGSVNKISGIGQYLVVCQIDLGGTPYINGKLVTDAGALEGAEIPVSLSGGSGPVVAGNNETQEYLVAWINNSYIVARTISTAGASGPIGQMDGQVPLNLAITSGSRGDFLIADDDWLTPSYPFDVFGYLWGIRSYLPLIKR